MPYKLSDNGKGNKVLVMRGRKWVVLKAHPSHKEALAHLGALQAHVPNGTEGNVKEAEK